MIQLSLDGKRLYVTNSLLSGWDKQVIDDSIASHGCCANSMAVSTVELNQVKSKADRVKAVVNHLAHRPYWSTKHKLALQICLEPQ